jgi:predicted  nucleic acid-binding Zn-ribbon protein
MRAEIAEKDRLIEELRNKSGEEITSEQRDEQLLDLKMEKKFLENNIKFESQRQEDNRNSQINTFIDSHSEISAYKNDFKTACDNYKDLSPRQVYAILVDEM